MNDTLTTDIAKFVQTVVSAMGADLTTSIEESPEATRINLDGEDGGILVRRGGERPADAKRGREGGDEAKGDELGGHG